MNEYQEPYEKEISLTELLFFCLKKWRWIVAAMLIAAVLAGGYKYQSTARSNQAQQAAALLENDGEGEADEAEVIANPNVTHYELAIESWEKELEAMEEYISSSAIMQLDAYHLDTGSLTFYVSAGGQASTDALVKAYESFATDGRLAAAMHETNGSIAVSELQYLIEFDSTGAAASEIHYDGEREGGETPLEIQLTELGADGSGVFALQITADTPENCAAYTEAAREAIEAYSGQIQGSVGTHVLNLVSETQTERIDQSIQAYQSGILETYTSAFTQLKTQQEELETVLEEEGSTIVTNAPAAYASPAREAVKFAVIGLVLGAFLAAFVLVVIYLMSGKLQSTEQFQEEFGMPLLGQITKNPGKKRIFGFIDRWIQRMEEGAYADVTYEEQLRLAVANVKAAASKEQGLKKIMLTGTIAKDEAEAFCKGFASELEGITLAPYERIVYQASALEDVDSYDGVLFLEKKGASYTKLIRKERDLAADRDIKILGAVVL